MNFKFSVGKINEIKIMGGHKTYPMVIDSNINIDNTEISVNYKAINELNSTKMKNYIFYNLEDKKINVFDINSVEHKIGLFFELSDSIVIIFLLMLTLTCIKCFFISTLFFCVFLTIIDLIFCIFIFEAKAFKYLKISLKNKACIVIPYNSFNYNKKRTFEQIKYSIPDDRVNKRELNNFIGELRKFNILIKNKEKNININHKILRFILIISFFGVFCCGILQL